MLLAVLVMAISISITPEGSIDAPAGAEATQTDSLVIAEDNFESDFKDEDSDGLPDDWEIAHFGSLAQNYGDDYDGDGLTNGDEYRYRSDPAKPTTYVSEGESIQAAIDTAVEGDIVLVGRGTFSGSPVQLNFHGKAITLRAAQGPGITWLNGSFLFNSNETNQTVIDGFRMEKKYPGTSPAVQIEGASPTFINCIFINNQGSPGGAVSIKGGKPVIDGCYFIGNGAKETAHSDPTGAIYITDRSEPTLVNCIFNRNNDSSKMSYATIEVRGRSVVDIINCTFHAEMVVLENDGAVVNVTNSIMRSAYETTQNKYYTIENIREGQTTIRHSNIQGCRMPGSPSAWYAPFGIDGGGNIDVDPLFASEDDLHLQAGSPCMDKGIVEGAPEYDIDGDRRARVDFLDMGADEVEPYDDDIPPEIEYFRGTPTSTYPCKGVELEWAVRDAETISIGPGVGSNLPASGTIYLYPKETTIYRLHAQTGNASSEKELTITVGGSDDMDGDGIIDGVEVCSCSQVNNPDTDDDGLSDGSEDANHNGILDANETNPCEADTDGDGMDDGWEVDNGLNPHLDDAQGDPDGDTFTNIVEHKGDTDPNDAKSYPRVTRFKFNNNGSMKASQWIVPPRN